MLSLSPMKAFVHAHPKTIVLFVAVVLVAATVFAFRTDPPAPRVVLPPRLEVAAQAVDVALRPLDEPVTNTAQPLVALPLPDALAAARVDASCKANGRDHMVLTVRNRDSGVLSVRVPAGMLFRAGHNLVLVLRTRDFSLAPGEQRPEELVTAAAYSGNTVAETPYEPAGGILPSLEGMLEYLEKHPETSPTVAQTVVLALQENLPLRAFAKFAIVGNDLPSRIDTTPFKVDTTDILQALTVLRELGIPDERLALTVDPQLRIEGMIDPLAHAAAMRYFKITPEAEWAFWKDELANGNPSTRHYALYGIARYFPDVAMQMLPRWARESRTSRVLRLSAIQAMAETQRPEAVSVLRQISYELGGQSEVGQAAVTAADFLDARLAKSTIPSLTIAFRGNVDLPQ
jgi:hypothetical protein